MKNLFTFSASLFIVMTAVPAFANVKVRTERTATGQTYQVTVYILGEVSGRGPDQIDR